MNRIALYLFCIVLASSCVTKNVNEIDLALSPQNAKELIAKVNSKIKHPEWLALKGTVNLKLEKDNEVSLGISIRVRKDSIIWASVSAPFGIELFRAVLTNDSLYYINRTNKTYFAKAIGHISEIIKTNIAFNEIQEMIMANPKIIKKKYSFAKTNDDFLLSAQDYTYTITNSYRIQKGVLMDEENSLTYIFSNFIFENDFPEQLELIVKSSSKKVFNLKLIYSKIFFNQHQKTPFKIPNSYVESK